MILFFTEYSNYSGQNNSFLITGSTEFIMGIISLTIENIPSLMLCIQSTTSDLLSLYGRTLLIQKISSLNSNFNDIYILHCALLRI